MTIFNLGLGSGFRRSVLKNQSDRMIRRKLIVNKYNAPCLAMQSIVVKCTPTDVGLIMGKSGLKTERLPMIRVNPKLKKELEKESENIGLDLSAYIRHLLITDPRRKKKTAQS